MAILFDPNTELAQHFPKLLTGLHQVLHGSCLVSVPKPAAFCSMARPYNAGNQGAADPSLPIAMPPIDLDDSAAVAESAPQDPIKSRPSGGPVPDGARLRGRYDKRSIIYHAPEQMDVFTARQVKTRRKRSGWMWQRVAPDEAIGGGGVVPRHNLAIGITPLVE